MRASIRRAIDRTDGQPGLDWLSAPEVSYARAASAPYEDAPVHERLLAGASRMARECAAEEPGELFGVFFCVGDSAESVDGDEPIYIAPVVSPWAEAA